MRPRSTCSMIYAPSKEIWRESDRVTWEAGPVAIETVHESSYLMPLEDSTLTGRS